MKSKIHLKGDNENVHIGQVPTHCPDKTRSVKCKWSPTVSLGMIHCYKACMGFMASDPEQRCGQFWTSDMLNARANKGVIIQVGTKWVEDGMSWKKFFISKSAKDGDFQIFFENYYCEEVIAKSNLYILIFTFLLFRWRNFTPSSRQESFQGHCGMWPQRL